MTNEITRVQQNKAQLAYLDTEEVTRIATVVQKVAQWANGMKPEEIGLSVRRCMALGVDPLNHHEIQIWKDKRGTINFQLAYTLMSEWVRHFKGDHTEPQYTRLTDEQLSDEGLRKADVAYRVTFIMRDDLKNVIEAAKVFGPEDARAMYTISGIGVAESDEYNGQYFAANGRSKSWKVRKRALVDAYRRRFGTPTKSEIEELRRIGGLEDVEPEDWEGTEELAPDDAENLAKSRADRRANSIDGELVNKAASALFNSDDSLATNGVESLWPESIEVRGSAPDPEEPPADDGKMTLAEAEETTTKKGTRFADLTRNQLETVLEARSTTKREKRAAAMLLAELDRMEAEELDAAELEPDEADNDEIPL